MNRILRTLLPQCDASTRALMYSIGASGVLHVLAGAAIATWFGSMAPHLFPPRQGFNSIQLTASQVIHVEAVDAEPETGSPSVLQTAVVPGDVEPAKANLDRQPDSGTPPTLDLSASVEAFAPPSAIHTESSRRTDSERAPDTSSDSPVLPRAEPAEPPLPTQTSVASIASQQEPGQLDAIPTQIYSPQPEYPAAALERRIEGRVVLRVKIDADGLVAATSVLRSSGHPILDEAARQAVLRWRFDPPKRLGIAVQTEVAVPVRFQIEDQ